MNLLALETSTVRASVALSWGDQRYQLEENTLNRHAEWILSAVEQLLQQAGATLSALQGIVFGQGPGSFTGLRITCGVAKGLALGAGLPLYPVSGLAAIEAQVVAETRQKAHILTVLDARMQAWYWALFSQGHMQGKISLDAPGQLPLEGSAPLWVAGVGFTLAQLPAAVQVRVIGSEELYPSAAALIDIVRRGGSVSVGVGEAEPLYVYQWGERG